MKLLNMLANVNNSDSVIRVNGESVAAAVILLAAIVVLIMYKR